LHAAVLEHLDLLLRDLVTDAPVGIAVVDEDLRYVLVNEALATMHGVPGAEHIGRRVDEVAPRLAAEVREAVEEARRTGRPVLDVRVEGIPADGADGRATWSKNVFPLPAGPGGDRAGYGVVVLDVTATVATEGQRDEALAMLRGIYDAAPVGLAAVDASCRFTQVNAAMAAINRRPAAGHLGRHPLEVSPDFAPVVRLFEETLRTGRPLLDVQVEGPADDRAFTASYYPVRVDGEVVGAGAVVREITEMRRLERERATIRAALAGERSVLQEVLRRVPSGIALLRGPDLVVELANEAAMRLAPRRDDRDPLGRPAAEVVVDAVAPVVERLREVRRTGRRYVDPELKVAPHGDGAWSARRWFDVSIDPVPGPDGRPDAVLLVAAEVTGRVRRREDAAREHERTRFLATASSRLDSHLTVDGVLQELADLCVPALADAAMVTVPRSGGGTLQAAAGDPALRADAGHPRLTVPLGARGHEVGELTLLGRDAGWLARADRQLAERFAGRAGLVVDTVLLLDDRRRVATTLQRGLLPPALPPVEGARLRAFFQAGGSGMDVGGDFYDAHACEDGTWALTLGDVCGRGAEAAVLSGLVRFSLRGASEQRSPARALQRVNDLMLGSADHADARFATAVTVRMRMLPDGGAHLRIACAGHPPPILVGPGTARPLPVAGQLLGVLPDIDVGEVEQQMEPGDALVLYTDGLLEARRDDLLTPVALAARLAHAGPDPEALAAVLETLVGDHDDTAFLLCAVS
jgi:PAS domain S-box-containing protein